MRDILQEEHRDLSAEIKVLNKMKDEICAEIDTVNFEISSIEEEND